MANPRSGLEPDAREMSQARHRCASIRITAKEWHVEAQKQREPRIRFSLNPVKYCHGPCTRMITNDVSDSHQ
jgi:hypothetical protein